MLAILIAYTFGIMTSFLLFSNQNVQIINCNGNYHQVQKNQQMLQQHDYAHYNGYDNLSKNEKIQFYKKLINDLLMLGCKGEHIYT